MIVERVRERHQRYEHVAVDVMPKLTDLKELVYIGSFSWTLQSSRKRLIGLNGRRHIEGMLCTAADLARDYLAIKYPDKLKATGEQVNEIFRHRSHPLYAKLGRCESAVYLDLKSAYWSILQTVGWNCDYFPRRWIRYGAEMQDFPFADDKLCRNCLVTAGLVAPRKIWNGAWGMFYLRNEGNPRPNYGLWALVQDTLHSIASEVIDVGGIYVHTDGYICPVDAAADVASIIAGWGFKASIKAEGAVTIYGAGAYSFAGSSPRKHSHMRNDFDNVSRLDYQLWLKNRIAKAAHWRLR